MSDTISTKLHSLQCISIYKCFLLPPLVTLDIHPYLVDKAPEESKENTAKKEEQGQEQLVVKQFHDGDCGHTNDAWKVVWEDNIETNERATNHVEHQPGEEQAVGVEDNSNNHTSVTGDEDDHSNENLLPFFK